MTETSDVSNYVEKLAIQKWEEAPYIIKIIVLLFESLCPEAAANAYHVLSSAAPSIVGFITVSFSVILVSFIFIQSK